MKIGETSGTLGENLKRLAEFLEEEMDFKADIVSALIYPFLIIFVGIVTVIVTESEAEPPVPVQVIL